MFIVSMIPTFMKNSRRLVKRIRILIYWLVERDHKVLQFMVELFTPLLSFRVWLTVVLLLIESTMSFLLKYLTHKLNSKTIQKDWSTKIKELMTLILLTILLSNKKYSKLWSLKVSKFIRDITSMKLMLMKTQESVKVLHSVRKLIITKKLSD